MSAAALASSAGGGAVPAAPRNRHPPQARSSPDLCEDDGVRADRSSRSASRSALARTSAPSQASSDGENSTGLLTRHRTRLGGTSGAASARERCSAADVGKVEPNNSEFEESIDSDDEPSDSDKARNLTQADMYIKSRHDPGDGKRSTKEAWREYLDTEVEISVQCIAASRTYVLRASGFRKLILAAHPDSSGAGKNDTNVRRKFQEFLDWRKNPNREEVLLSATNARASVINTFVAGLGTPASTRPAGVRKLIFVADPDSLWDDVRRFLQEASDEEKKEAAIETDEEGRNALHLLCSTKPPKDVAGDVVQLLTERGGRDMINEADEDGCLPIHVACKQGASKEVIRLLMGWGGSDTLKEVDKNGWLPIHLACENGVSKEVIRLLTDWGGTDMLKEAGNGVWLPIHCACANKASEEVVRLLIDQGGSDTLKVAQKNGRLPIHYACEQGASKEVVNLLIDRGGSVTLNEADKIGRLPVHFACANKASEEVVRLLIDRGGSNTLKVTENNDWLPIHCACEQGASEEVIRLLIDRGGSDTLKKADKNGWLPIHLACEKGASEEVVRLLLDSGGSNTLKVGDMYDGRLPIHWACSKGASEEIVRLLIDQGGSDTLRAADKDNRLPLYMALKAKASEGIIRLLIGSGGVDDWKTARAQKDVLLAWLLNATPEQRRACLRHGGVKQALNRHFTARPVLAMMMMDLYMQVLLITVFSITSSHSINKDGGIEMWQLSVLIICLLWFAMRELMQLLTLKAYRYYATDVWNLVDWSQIILVGASMAEMNSNTPISTNDSIRTILTVTIGIVWLALLGVMKHFLYGIAIFLASLQQILVKLVPFIVVTAVTTAAFVFMLHTANSKTEYCDESKWYCGTLGQLFMDLSAFVLSLSEIEIEREIMKDSETTAGVVFFFGFMIALIFLNILIAKISNIFSATEAEGDRYFWENRLSVVAEADSIRHILRNDCFFLPCGWKKKRSRSGKDRSDSMQGGLGESLKGCIFFADDWKLDDIVDLMFGHSESKKKLLGKLLKILLRVLVPIMLLCFFVLGLVSLGILWPKWMTRFMFFGRTKERLDNLAQKLSGCLKEEVEKNREEMEEKISSTEARLERKISAMEERIEQKISTTEARIERKISAMEERIERKISSMDERMDQKISAIDERFKEEEESRKAFTEETTKTMSLILKQLEEMNKRSFSTEM